MYKRFGSVIVLLGVIISAYFGYLIYTDPGYDCEVYGHISSTTPAEDGCTLSITYSVDNVSYVADVDVTLDSDEVIVGSEIPIDYRSSDPTDYTISYAPMPKSSFTFGIPLIGLGAIIYMLGKEEAI